MYKRLLLIFSLILGSSGVAGFFISQQVMQLPSWYTNSEANQTIISANQTKKPLSSEEVLRKVSHGLTAKTIGEVDLDATEINLLIAKSLTKNNQTSEYTTAIKSTNTQIKNGKISVGAVIETSSIPVKKLPTLKQTKIIQLLQNLPGKQKQLYIGIEGKPSIRNQEVSFDDTTRVSLGNFSFPIAEVSQNIGISQDSFNQLLADELKKLPIKFESINIQGERVIIRGSRNRE